MPTVVIVRRTENSRGKGEAKKGKGSVLQECNKDQKPAQLMSWERNSKIFHFKMRSLPLHPCFISSSSLLTKSRFLWLKSLRGTWNEKSQG